MISARTFSHQFLFCFYLSSCSDLNNFCFTPFNKLLFEFIWFALLIYNYLPKSWGYCCLHSGRSVALVLMSSMNNSWTNCKYWISLRASCLNWKSHWGVNVGRRYFWACWSYVCMSDFLVLALIRSELCLGYLVLRQAVISIRWIQRALVSNVLPKQSGSVFCHELVGEWPSWSQLNWKEWQSY